MQVAKWGNSLAVRIPKDVVDALGLKVGDHIDVNAVAPRSFELSRQMSVEEALKGLRKYRGMMPADFKFDREEANAR